MNVHGFDELTDIVGEGTPYEATITAVPIDDEGDLSWRGYVRFKDDNLNMHVEFEDFRMVENWVFPGEKSGGTYMMNLLFGYHEQIVSVFEKIRATAVGKVGIEGDQE